MNTILRHPLEWCKSLFTYLNQPINLFFAQNQKALAGPAAMHNMYVPTRSVPHSLGYDTMALGSLTSATPVRTSSVIESYGTFLPSTTVSSAATVKAVRQVKYIPLRYVTGIKKRRVSDQYSSIELAYQAVTKCFERSRYRPSDIDLVICCHIAKLDKQGGIAYYEPTAALEVHRHFGMTHAICFDINNACAGIFTAIYIADKMIRAGTLKRALICSGEHISPLCRTAQKEIDNLRDPRLACLTLGDAGAALILDASGNDKAGFKYTAIKTMAEHSTLCMASPTSHDHGGIIMHTQSGKITSVGRDESFRFLIDKMAKKLVAVTPSTKVIHHQVATRLP